MKPKGASYRHADILAFSYIYRGCFMKLLGALKGFVKPPYRGCFMKFLRVLRSSTKSLGALYKCTHILVFLL